MKLGLVTVLYKSDEVLPDFFKSISQQAYKNFVLYLVDNSPTDATLATVKALANQYPTIVYNHIICKENTGVAAGNNIGIKEALKEGCKDIIILNNDIEFNNPNLFSELIALCVQQQAAVIAPKIYFAGTNQIWYAGSKFIEWNCNIKHTGEFQQDIQQYPSSYTAYAPTCFVYVKNEIFTQVGLMDETYFVYVDDLDFMYRLRKKGYSIWYENSLVIDHKISQSTGGKFSTFSLHYAIRNRIYFARKFYSLPAVILVAAYAFVSLSYHIIFKEKKPSLFKILYKAIIAGFTLQPKASNTF